VWIIMAWQRFSPEVTAECFQKPCISSAVDGTDDDMLCDGSAEDGDARKMKQLTGNVVVT
jgi:hypothetical protein